MNKICAIICLFMYLSVSVAGAAGIDKNTAKMQAMDKITGRVSVINVPVGGMVEFGSLSIVVRSCKTRPMEETPDNFAFADISDKTLKGDEVNIFRGWMISSSPATHAVEHPIYDVWLLSCEDKKVDKKLLLSEEQLAAHENIPAQSDTSYSAEHKPVETAQEAEPITEMQEDAGHKETPVEQNIEFSYDETEEIEETEENDGEAENTGAEITSEEIDSENI